MEFSAFRYSRRITYFDAWIFEKGCSRFQAINVSGWAWSRKRALTLWTGDPDKKEGSQRPVARHSPEKDLQFPADCLLLLHCLDVLIEICDALLNFALVPLR
jgi:hypothetical protein